jgi:hypothetical protein
VPLQNRVTPYGAIIATPARGTLLGNRGCLHDGAGRIRRPYQCRRWISCVLAFKGRRRTLMAPGRYTELFFLDEAVALAAGHRPCAECRRARYLEFREHWARANAELIATPRPAATEIDRILHAERIGANRRKVTYPAPPADLPDGTFIASEQDDAAYLVLGGVLLPWSPEGYGPPRALPADGLIRVLTPRSIVRALAGGYRPLLHPSATRRAG